jgi:hypothetical protein
LEDELLKGLRLIAGFAMLLLMLANTSTATLKQSVVGVHKNPVYAGTIAAIEIATSQPVRFTAQGDEVFTHEAAGVQFHLPKGWKAEPDGEQILVTAPDNSFSIVFWVPEEDSFEEAVKALDEELAKTIQKMKPASKGKSGSHNGMEHFTATGTGEVEGVAVSWSVDLLAAKKPLIILTFAADGKTGKYLDDYKNFVMSIKRK